MGAFVVAAGLAIGAAALKGDAARKAANARKDALGNMELINVGKEQELALEADKKRIANQIKLQQDVDPTVAAVREGGAKGVLDTLYSQQDKQAEALGTNMYDEFKNDTPGLSALKEKLLADANADLARGAELPPEFQAELVKAGLQSAGTAGFLPDATGMAGRTAREMLGKGGLALKEARRTAAVDTGKAVSDMSATRASILSRVIPTLQSITTSRAQRAGLAFNLGEAAMPEAGLSGAESANLDLARIAQQNKQALGLGDVEAAKRTAEGEMWSSMLGSASSALGGAASIGTFGAGAQKAATALGYGNLGKTTTTTP